ncbi:MAG: hypothetical protein N3A62_04105 [Thermodesulfovibrionales bacterium]|nr:hypothetical protein [Thermodesulfovibrionales bacterium]
MIIDLENKKVSDLTVKEFKELLSASIKDLIDDDYGYEMREQVIREIQQASNEIKKGNSITLEEVAEKYGIRFNV